MQDADLRGWMKARLLQHAYLVMASLGVVQGTHPIYRTVSENFHVLLHKAH